ncbi:Uncharacterized conserved protein YcbK, DUF882 family [Granulicella rosea]|uniref:Murein endopeptidase K n=1 Tax=Granulicella rosea TaxID=474952 RepID=A0A239LCZ8_9BACT|nr:DUF882 domain-containing protein [Granulicella rosea]SNT28160.1 Uncharacterized conserved protein YcbK, DUF882 family [Granulicella rosea]
MFFTASLRSALFSKKLPALCALALFCVAAPAANAATHHRSLARRHPRLRALAHVFADVTVPGAGLLLDEDEEAPADGKQYELKLVRAHTNEMVDVVYRIGDTYIPEALDKLNTFLRDSHNQEVSEYDPREFDVLHTMLAKVNKPGSVIDILSGYRSQETNDALRESGKTNAAKHSEHIEAKAIDLRVDGVPAATLRDAALELGVGGVGYYPKAQFVHVDVGPVREWTYAPHARKARGHGRRRSRRSKRS